ncbi:hypothetical protein ACFGVR_04625 [Mucilaginibacter sp. AW1-3]
MDKKKLWQQPVLLVMPVNHTIYGGGPNSSLREVRTGNHHISSVVHGGSATVSTAAYNNVMS